VSEENSSQSWNLDCYGRNVGFVENLGGGVMDLLAPQAEERILNLGCGSGKLTENLVAGGAGILAVDASDEQVEGACERGLDSHVVDATQLTFKREFGAFFLNAGLHWVKDAGAAIAGVKQSLVPGGRFVGELGGQANVARVELGLECAMARRGLAIADFWPWYLLLCEDYDACLEAPGFKVTCIKLFQRPTPITGELVGWLKTFGESFLNLVATDDREVLAPDLKNSDGNWSVDYVRLRFQAFLP
jgi:trans-aconitate methyltransferase